MEPPITTYSVDPTLVEPVFFKVEASPTTGSTIQLNRYARQYLLLKPAIGLLALTVNFPTNPVDKDVVVIGTSKSVTVLTLGGMGNTILAGLSSLILGGFGRWVYDAPSTSWFRIG